MARRTVEFTVASETVTPAELTARLGPGDQVTVQGEPGRVTGRPARENAWTIRAEGGPDRDIDTLVETALDRVAPLAPELAALSAEGCAAVLRIVQYISAMDPSGPGFALEPEQLALLTRVGAFVDVDLYVRET